jgi:hypothetical protein
MRPPPHKTMNNVAPDAFVRGCALKARNDRCGQSSSDASLSFRVAEDQGRGADECVRRHTNPLLHNHECISS